MIIRTIEPKEKTLYNKVVKHPLQSWEWGEFRKETNVELERVGFFDKDMMMSGLQVTFHAIPHTSYTAGYLPKGTMPDEEQLKTLKELGEKHHALYVKIEPNVASLAGVNSGKDEIVKFLASRGCVPGRPLFSKYTFILDISKPEEQLLAEMKQKTRYNVSLAQKKGVTIIENSTDAGLKEYLSVQKETTKRQAFYAHSDAYFTKMWKAMSEAGIAHIFKAVFEGKTLAVWIVFVYNDVLYYPYGASSSEHRELMASNLLMWEVIRFGKSQGCTKFDMWGSLGLDADPKDPWYGFHKFKEGYNPVLMQFLGSYDLVLNAKLYKLYRVVENWRWKILRLKATLLR